MLREENAEIFSSLESLPFFSMIFVFNDLLDPKEMVPEHQQLIYKNLVEPYKLFLEVCHNR